MTHQHRCTSAIESTTQAVVGIPIGFTVSFAVGLMHISSAVISAGLITLIMFFASTLRGYIIRRRFERINSWQSYGRTMEYVFKKGLKK